MCIKGNASSFQNRETLESQGLTRSEVYFVFTLIPILCSWRAVAGLEVGVECSALCSHSRTQDDGGRSTSITWLSGLAGVPGSSLQVVGSGVGTGVGDPMGGFNRPDLEVDTLAPSIFCWPERSLMVTSTCKGAWEMLPTVHPGGKRNGLAKQRSTPYLGGFCA